MSGHRVDTRGLAVAWSWEAAARDLSRSAISVPRTSSISLGQWPIANEDRPDLVGVQTLVGSGVCLDDLASYCRVRRDGEGSAGDTAGWLAHDLTTIERYWWNVTLRDAVGWILVGNALDPGQDVEDLMSNWSTPDGVFPEGWRYFAAGLDRDEVDERTAQGSLDEDAITVLLGLSGIALPR